ncbi:L,D-transpeptidase family protein [Halopseudomonas salegens]|uniref:L,D-transpeptidase ErfK/SrfK n=1 Tax=Halopseudomonas salegens TaxID=1434072 RepID=A0A1H2FHQ2_9GAMM|nr:L,D-transpeptidase family protein [Halopseudomonas salegens]SDU06845.1 L,D-transpeptidase ErfK/SrfK [Halopseudomonas salegens]
MSTMIRCCAGLLLLLLLSPSLLAREYPWQPGNHLVGELFHVPARFEDTFHLLGKKHGYGYLELLAANPDIDPWLPGEGTAVLMPGQHVLPHGATQGILINLPEFRLYFFSPEGDSVVTYPIGIGREGWASPTGETQVRYKEANPRWFPPQSIIEDYALRGEHLPRMVPPGPENPLGAYKMNLAMGAYVIHGTNKPFGIGMRVSSGCFRLDNNDIGELFPQVPLGTPVTIVNQPFKLGIHQGALYLEAHTPLDEHGLPTALDRFAAIRDLMSERAELTYGMRLDWARIREVVDAAEGVPVKIGEPLRL